MVHVVENVRYFALKHLLLGSIIWSVNPQEPGAKEMETVRSYMLEYLADGSRSYSEPYFTVSEVKNNSFVDDIYYFFQASMVTNPTI